MLARAARVAVAAACRQRRMAVTVTRVVVRAAAAVRRHGMRHRHVTNASTAVTQNGAGRASAATSASSSPPSLAATAAATPPPSVAQRAGGSGMAPLTLTVTTQHVLPAGAGGAHERSIRLDRFVSQHYARSIRHEQQRGQRLDLPHELPRSLLLKLLRQRAFIVFEPDTGATNADGTPVPREKLRNKYDGSLRLGVGHSVVIPGYVLQRLRGTGAAATVTTTAAADVAAGSELFGGDDAASTATNAAAAAPLYAPTALSSSSGSKSSNRQKQQFELSAFELQQLHSSVLYRDEHILALNKPPGMSVQGGSGAARHWHLDGLLHHLTFEYDDTPKLVHRLDRDASGVLLLARTPVAAHALAALFAQKSLKSGTDPAFGMQKRYWALCVGEPPATRDGIIDAALTKLVSGDGGGGSSERMVLAGSNAVSAPNVFTASTEFHALRTSTEHALTWYELQPLTGRKHQLRAHARYVLHAPIVGDDKYGAHDALRAMSRTHPALVTAVGNGLVTNRLHLHARSLTFRHPIFGGAASNKSSGTQQSSSSGSGHVVHIVAPPPDHFTASLRALNWSVPRDNDSP